jgi:membrane fusion protein, multidrug efflux system
MSMVKATPISADSANKAPQDAPELRTPLHDGPADMMQANGDGAHRTTRPRFTTRTRVFGLMLAGIAAAALYTAHYFSYAGTHPGTDDAFVQGDTAVISAKVFGRVGRVMVRGYQHVQKGELLVELDPLDAEIAVRQAQAALDAAQTRVRQANAALIAQQHEASAALAQAQAAQTEAAAHVPQTQTTVRLEDQTVRESISIAQAQLAAATAQVTSAHSNLSKARNDLERAQALFGEGAIASQEVDQAQAAYDAAAAQDHSAVDAVAGAQASLAQAEAAELRIPIRRLDVAAAIAQQAQAAAGLEAARAGFDVVAQREAELATARAAVAQAEALLAAARQQLDYTSVFAPDDAIVGSDVPVQPGQVVQPGQTLLTLVFSSNKWVQANFKETQLGAVRIGQPATIRVDLLRRTFHGHVERLGPATGAALSVLPAQNATGNFTKVVQRVPVRIVLDDAPDDLQVGLSVEATIDTSSQARPAGEIGANAR